MAETFLRRELSAPSSLGGGGIEGAPHGRRQHVRAWSGDMRLAAIARDSGAPVSPSDG